MVRLKTAYWEFDFEAVCPNLDHDLLSQAHMGYKKNSHFMIDVLNLKLCFVTDVLTERSGSLSEPSSILFILI